MKSTLNLGRAFGMLKMRSLQKKQSSNLIWAHLAEGNDVIVGGAGRDEIVSGDGNNVVASGDLSAVILNSELDDDHTFLNYDEDDLLV